MDLVVLTGVVIAIAMCIGLIPAGISLWLQLRSVRVSEQQLRSQVETMQNVLDKIEEERRAREGAVDVVESQLNLVDSRFTDSHQRNWDRTSAAITLQSMQFSKLAVAVSLFAHSQSLLPGLDASTRERFEATADLALALAGLAELNAKFTEEMSRWRYQHRVGETAKTPEQVSAGFDEEREREAAAFSAASERFAKAFRRETS
ncbi:MAG: hypothetical protein ACREA0_31160 [bacterium]